MIPALEQLRELREELDEATAELEALRDEQAELARQALKERYPAGEVAAAMGVSRQSLYRIARSRRPR